MNYLKITLFYRENNVWKDVLIQELGDMGFESFEDNGSTSINAYIPEKSLDENKLQQIQQAYAEKLPFTYKKSSIQQKNWNKEWEKNFSPIFVNNRLLIQAPFHQIAGDFEYRIIINPKMAFGTGHHATTFLMLKNMFEESFSGKNVLDMGCGTGVLAIFAAMRQAKNITAIDIDEWAYKNTLENIRINHLNEKTIQVFLGGVEAIPASLKYDIILANINKNVLKEQIPNYILHLNPNGLLYLSGILSSDKEEMVNYIRNHSLSVIKTEEYNNWLFIKCKK